MAIFAGDLFIWGAAHFIICDEMESKWCENEIYAKINEFYLNIKLVFHARENPCFVDRAKGYFCSPFCLEGRRV